MTRGRRRGLAGNWACGEGTVCTPIASATGTRMKLAQCLLPPKSEAMFSGHPCLTGEIASNESQPFNDRMKITGQFAAFAPAISRTDYNCRPPKIGVPGGLAYRACTDKDRNFAGFKPGKPMPNEICGLVGGKKFDVCVATNNFDQCLGGAVNRGNRPACSADHFCREDYMCQALAARHARHRQGERHRLLLADLFHFPDAHRQPRHAVGKRADRHRGRRLRRRRGRGGGGRVKTRGNELWLTRSVAAYPLHQRHGPERRAHLALGDEVDEHVARLDRRSLAGSARGRSAGTLPCAQIFAALAHSSSAFGV